MYAFGSTLFSLRPYRISTAIPYLVCSLVDFVLFLYITHLNCIFSISLFLYFSLLATICFVGVFMFRMGSNRTEEERMFSFRTLVNNLEKSCYF
jgi:hypothetical protein